jgi:hypothetical protein
MEFSILMVKNEEPADPKFTSSKQFYLNFDTCLAHNLKLNNVPHKHKIWHYSSFTVPWLPSLP